MMKRLNEGEIGFPVASPAGLLTDSQVGILTQPVKWGSAQALLSLGTKPGTVTERASAKRPGAQKDGSGVIRFDTEASGLKMFFTEDTVGRAKRNACIPSFAAAPSSEREKSFQMELGKVRHELNSLSSEKVSARQTYFE